MKVLFANTRSRTCDGSLGEGIKRLIGRLQLRKEENAERREIAVSPIR